MLRVKSPSKSLQATSTTLNDHTTNATNFRQVLKAIHRGAINTFTDTLLVNSVLGVHSTPKSEEELELPREPRFVSLAGPLLIQNRP